MRGINNYLKSVSDYALKIENCEMKIRI